MALHMCKITNNNKCDGPRTNKVGRIDSEIQAQTTQMDFFDFAFLHLMDCKQYIEPSHIVFCCKKGFFLALWQQAANGESVRGRVIWSNMRLSYTTHQAADPLFSLERRERALDHLFSLFSSFLSLYIVLSNYLG